MILMLGESFSGNLLPLTQFEATLRDSLKRHVEKLANDIGERNYLHYKGLVRAADFLDSSFAEAGYWLNNRDIQLVTGTAPFRYPYYRNQ